MSLRVALVALIVAATATFVVGVALERNSGEFAGEHRAEASQPFGETGAGEDAHSEADESAEHRQAEGTASQRSGGEHDAELRPLGIDIEAWPFLMLAALASLALAAAAWLRPTALPVLLAVTVTMLAFAALDVHEIFHQADESHDGLATLAGIVAALHAAAGAVAAATAPRARRAPGAAGTILA
jgi:hypothetical protein